MFNNNLISYGGYLKPLTITKFIEPKKEQPAPEQHHNKYDEDNDMEMIKKKVHKYKPGERLLKELNMKKKKSKQTKMRDRDSELDDDDIERITQGISVVLQDLEL